MRNIIIYLILISTTTVVEAQVSFTHGDSEMFLVDRKTFSQPIPYDQQVSIYEDPWVKVFKQYFNSSSFDVFKSFFLPQDWGGFSVDQYNQWQKTLRADKLYLEQVLLVKDAAGNEFLVFQYFMETPARTLFHSMMMKRHQQSWKHVSIMNDQQALILKRLGDMDIASLNEKMQSRAPGIKLDQLQVEQTRTYKEKFNRQEIFSTIAEVLKAFNVSEGDVTNARQFFLTSQDNLMIDFIVTQYKMDKSELIETINAKCGFMLLQQARITETN